MFETCHGSCYGYPGATIGGEIAAGDRQRLEGFVVKEHLELLWDENGGPAGSDQSPISHEAKFLAVFVRPPVAPSYLSSLRRGGSPANKKSGIVIEHLVCSMWEARKPRRW